MTLMLTLLTVPLAMAATGSTKPRTASSPGKGAAVQPAQPKLIKGNPLLGRDKAESERCSECHGIEGLGQANTEAPGMKYPRLAGLPVAYIAQQVEAFRTGARKNDQMTIMAKAVSDEDLADIAAYFSGLPAATP